MVSPIDASVVKLSYGIPGLVELWDFRKAKYNIPLAVSLVATTSTGITRYDPKVLHDKLVELGHESPFEFISYFDDELDRRVTYRGDPERVTQHKPGSRKEERVYTFRLKVPIFVARQIMRHRSFSYMELSRRYTSGKRVPYEFYHPHVSLLSDVLYYCSSFASRIFYKLLRFVGVKQQLARIVMPVSTYTIFWMQGDHRAFANFFLYRLHRSAQPETRSVAIIMAALLKDNDMITPIIESMKEIAEGESLFKKARKKYLTEALKVINNL